MAKIHVLERAGPNVYTVTVHTSTPAGNNAAGTAWADAVKNSGRATTIMTIGNAAGQITQAEANNIAAGTVIEGVMQWGDDPAWNNTQRTADLDIRATQLVAELLARYQEELKYFGFTRN